MVVVVVNTHQQAQHMTPHNAQAKRQQVGMGTDVSTPCMCDITCRGTCPLPLNHCLDNHPHSTPTSCDESCPRIVAEFQPITYACREVGGGSKSQHAGKAGQHFFFGLSF